MQPLRDSSGSARAAPFHIFLSMNCGPDTGHFHAPSPLKSSAAQRNLSIFCEASSCQDVAPPQAELGRPLSAAARTHGADHARHRCQPCCTAHESGSASPYTVTTPESSCFFRPAPWPLAAQRAAAWCNGYLPVLAAFSPAILQP